MVTMIIIITYQYFEFLSVFPTKYTLCHLTSEHHVLLEHIFPYAIHICRGLYYIFCPLCET